MVVKSFNLNVKMVNIFVQKLFQTVLRGVCGIKFEYKFISKNILAVTTVIKGLKMSQCKKGLAF